jgi:WD40 repeat protein
MAHLPTCSLLVSGADDGSITFWNPDSGSTIILKYHSNTVSCLDIAQLRRNDYVLSGGYDGKVGIWDVTLRKTVKPRLENIFTAHEGENGEILCICFNKGGSDSEVATFFTGGNDCSIKVWNISTFRRMAELKGHTDAVTCLSQDINFLFSGSEDKSIRIWNVSNISDAYQVSSSMFVSDILRDTSYPSHFIMAQYITYIPALCD